MTWVRRPPKPVLISAEDARNLRKATGLTQTKLAATFGLGVATVRKWENGTGTVPKWAILLLRIMAAKRQALITGQRPTVDID